MEPLPLSRRHPLHGRNLRHAALVVLHRYGSASIGEILEVLWANDFRVTGTRIEAGKRLSDALRHEVRLGRARRVARGNYAVGRLARSTRYRILRRWRLADPARCDEEGEPILEGRSPDDRIGEIPWTRHDRNGHQLWLDNQRSRWEIGRNVRAALTLARRIERVAEQTLPRLMRQQERRGQELLLLTHRRRAHIDAICARSTLRAAEATRHRAARPTSEWWPTRPSRPSHARGAVP